MTSLLERIGAGSIGYGIGMYVGMHLAWRPYLTELEDPAGYVMRLMYVSYLFFILGGVLLAVAHFRNKDSKSKRSLRDGD
jgi:hypothetical protein